MTTFGRAPVSVIIPSYNSLAFLPESVRSAQAAGDPAEILIVDDCSEDGSAECAAQLASAIPTVRVLRTQRNSGAAEARRIGIEAATQEWVAFLDADDLLTPGAITNALHEAEIRGADMCIWDLWRFDQTKEWRSPANPEALPLTGSEAVMLTLAGWRMHPLGVSRRSLYEEAYRGFSVDCMNADELVTRRVLSLADIIVGCNGRYYYRHHSASSTQRLDAARLSTLRSHLWLLDFAQSYPDAPLNIMALNALRDAWFFWTVRRQIGVEFTRAELQSFLADFARSARPLHWLWRHPKYFAAWVFLSLETALLAA